MNNTNTLSTGQYFKIHQIIFYVFLAGQIMLSAVAFAIVHMNNAVIRDQSLSDLFMYIVPIVIIADFLAANFIYKQLLKAAKAKEPLKEKMSAYTTLTLIRLAFAEGASLFTIVAYLLTANIIFAGCAGILMVVFFAFKPSKEKVIMDLGLDHADIQSINDPNAVIAEVPVKRN